MIRERDIKGGWTQPTGLDGIELKKVDGRGRILR